MGRGKGRRGRGEEVMIPKSQGTAFTNDMMVLDTKSTSLAGVAMSTRAKLPLIMQDLLGIKLYSTCSYKLPAPSNPDPCVV